MRPLRPSKRDDLFEDTFAALYPRALRVAYRILGDRTMAEDVAAEAMARMFAEWRRVKELSYRDAWALKVVSNLALNAARDRRRVRAQHDEVDAEQVATDRVVLREALRSLPRRQREVVVLRLLSGLTEAEVAQALQISVGAVKKHGHRALVALRSKLGESVEVMSHGPQR